MTRDAIPPFVPAERPPLLLESSESESRVSDASSEVPEVPEGVDETRVDWMNSEPIVLVVGSRSVSEELVCSPSLTLRVRISEEEFPRFCQAPGRP